MKLKGITFISIQPAQDNLYSTINRKMMETFLFGLVVGIISTLLAVVFYAKVVGSRRIAGDPYLTAAIITEQSKLFTEALKRYNVVNYVRNS